MIETFEDLNTRLAGRPRAVSRAASPGLVEVLGRNGQLTILPISGGRTVWEAAGRDHVPVVETPNWLGVAEARPVDRAWLGIRTSPGVAAGTELIDGLVTDPSADRIRRLVNRLTSIRGISPYHREMVAPWVTLLASDPAWLAQPSPAVFVCALGDAFADIPGGVRLELRPGASADDVARYAAAVEAAIEGSDR